jgi:YfiH family protein
MKFELYEKSEKIIAGITLRDGTAAEEGNMALHSCISPDNVIENRRKLASVLGSGLDCFVCPSQTHSANFYQVTSQDKGKGAFEQNTAIHNTDAVYTFEPNILLCCFSADCVPVIFYNKVSGLIGLIHSGWQGTVKEITIKVFQDLIEKQGCKPEDFNVYIGKAISQEKFEVDVDVYQKFVGLGYTEPFMLFNKQTGKYHIDNKQIVKKQCELLGIPSGRIFVDPTCTYTDPACFSYRENRQCGRHMSFIIRKT